MKQKLSLGWLLAGILCLIGVVLYVAFPHFEFIRYSVWAVAGIVLCYLLIGLLKKKNKKISKVLSVCLSIFLIFGGLIAAITGILISTAVQSNPAAMVDYLIVLGASITDNTPSKSLQDRLDAAYHYLITHKDVICIVSGGLGNEHRISEAQCMFNDLTSRGIDPQRIWMEDQSRNTRENFAFSLDLIAQRTGSRPHTVGVLSSEYHLFRAGMVARWNHLTPVYIPAKTTGFFLFLNHFIREIPAVWYYLFLGGFQ